MNRSNAITGFISFRKFGLVTAQGQTPNLTQFHFVLFFSTQPYILKSKRSLPLHLLYPVLFRDQPELLGTNILQEIGE